MKKELTLLEQKVEQLILNNARLRAENHHLRQQLALHLNGQEVEPLDIPNTQLAQQTEQAP